MAKKKVTKGDLNNRDETLVQAYNLLEKEFSIFSYPNKHRVYVPLATSLKVTIGVGEYPTFLVEAYPNVFTTDLPE